MAHTTREHWVKVTEVRDRDIDFRNDPLFSAAVSQIEELRTLRTIERIVEVGSGSGRFLQYLNRVTGLPVLGSEVSEASLAAARQRQPHIAFMAGDALEILRRFSGPNVLVVAMNVLGNLDPAEARAFFDGIGGAVTFCARGMLAGESQARASGIGWDHNYTDLLAGLELLELQATPTPKFAGREAIVATAYRA